MPASAKPSAAITENETLPTMAIKQQPIIRRSFIQFIHSTLESPSIVLHFLFLSGEEKKQVSHSEESRYRISLSV
jgi:hypothetical protein